METFIVTPSTAEKMEALLAFMTALKIDFKKKKEKGYNAEFVAKIKRGEEAKKAGLGRVVKLEELEALWK